MVNEGPVTAEAAYLRAQRGDFNGVGAHVHALSTGDEEGRAWALVLRSQAAMADVPGAAMPNVSEIGALAAASPEARDVCGIACANGVRRAVLELDNAGLDQWFSAHEQLAAGTRGSRGEMYLSVSRLWRALLRGQKGGREIAASLSADAKSTGYADLQIEATVARAVVELAYGDLPAATQLIRRASRMARTESLPQQEYIANLVLCRVRRLAGVHHFSTLIARALLNVVPTAFRAALAWELAASGGGFVEMPLGDSAAAHLVRSLKNLLENAESGARGPFVAAEKELFQLSRGHQLFEADVDLLTSMLVVDRKPHPLAAAWCEGKVDEVPSGLHAANANGSTVPHAAFVAAGPNLKPRRVLAAGVGLLSEYQSLPDASRRQIRTDGTIATLLFAGESGLTNDNLFQAVYGFPFHDRNAGTRRMLYTRVRRRIEPQAELERDQGMVRVRATSKFLVPDPRCDPDPENDILRVLAQNGSMSARDTANALGIPLRTVQDTLKLLVETGTCVAVKSGSKLEYHLEDTTFQEPTAAGLRNTP